MKQQITSLLTLASSIGLLSAASISVNFNSDREAAALLPGESAGAPGYETTGWNNFDGIESAPAVSPILQSTADIDSPNAGSLTDDGGIVQGATSVSWTSQNSWNTNNGVANTDNKLMNGYIDNNATNGVSVDVTGIPYANYTVVAYFGSDGNGRTGEVLLNGSGFSYSTNSALTGGFPGGYAQTTDTVGGNPTANFAVWSGQTASDLTLSIVRGSNNSGLHGFQIIETVPEPSTSLLFGLTGLLLLRRKR